MMKYEHGWQAKVAYWIVQRLPPVIVREPERMLIGFFGVVTGIIMLVPAFHPPSIQEVLHPPQVWIWALCFLVGGLAKIQGIILLSGRKRTSSNRLNMGRMLERLGASCIGLGCLVYALVVLEVNGVSGVMTFIMFLGIALTNLVRLVVSVANGYLQELNSRGA